MVRKSMMLLVFLAACSHAASPPPSVSSARENEPAAQKPVETPTRAAATAAELTPSDTLSAADIEDERQLFYVKQAMTLYRQFLERADGRPELEPAIRKSQEKLEDLQQIAEMLEQSVRERERQRR